MAEFCRKCANNLGFEPDLTVEALEIPIGHYKWVLCEGCGTIVVVNSREHGEVVLRPEKLTII